MLLLPAIRPALLTGLFLATLAGALAQPLAVADVPSTPEADVVARLPDSHPAAYFAYAERLWFDARRNDAVVWLYIAQIRYRFFLGSDPKLEVSPESARFKQLMATVGEPIERYAGGDIPRWKAQIAAALAWDRDHPNNFTSKKRFASQWDDARTVLANLVIYLGRHSFEFNKQRELDGIGETGLTSPEGPYLDVRKPEMPHDWPALMRHTSLPMLNGYYVIDDPAVAALFFPSDPSALTGANNLQIAAEDDDRHLTVTVRRENTFLAENRVTVEEQEDAIVYTREIAATAAGLSQGQTVIRHRLRRNEIGDLIIQSDALTEGMFPGHKFQVHLEITQWLRAERVLAGEEPK